jgi:hypothetical protein
MWLGQINGRRAPSSCSRVEACLVSSGTGNGTRGSNGSSAVGDAATVTRAATAKEATNVATAKEATEEVT